MCMGLVDLRVQDFVEEDIDSNKAMEDPLTPRIDEPAAGERRRGAEPGGQQQACLHLFSP